MRRLSRLIAVLLSLAVLLVAVSIGASIYYAHQSKEASIVERLDMDVHTLYDTQDNMETALSTLANCFSYTHSLSEGNMITIMNSLKEERGFSFICRTMADGYAFNNEGKTDIYLGERDYFMHGMEGETTTSFITQGVVDSSSGYLLTAVPVYKDGKPDGIVHGSYSTDSYLSKVVETTSADTTILLLDTEGNILGIHGTSEISGNIKDYLASEKDVDGFTENLLNEKSASVDLTVDGVHTCAAYAPLKFDNCELFVMFATPTKSIPFSGEAFWHMAGILLSIHAILIVILLITAFGLWLFKVQTMKAEMEKEHLASMAAEQKMYHTIIDETANAIAVVDIETHEILYANAVALNLLTDEPATFIGGHCYSCIAHNDVPCEYCPIKNGGVVPQSREFVIKGRSYHQDFKPILWHGREALVEYNRDITEQKKTLSLIEQQKALQEVILDTIPAGIMVFKFTQDGIQIVSVNHSILDMMGMDKSKALGEASHNITALTHPDDLQIVLEAAKKLSVDGAYVEYEYRHFFRSRNDYIWVLGQGRSIRNPDGYVYAYVNYTDITSRKEVEVLQAKLKTAEISASTRSEFYSQMSHDMRTPMNGILGIAELAETENDVDALHDDIAKIKQSGKYMLSLINDTLDLQRLESHKLTLEPEVVRSSELFEKILSIVRPSMEQKNIRFIFHANKSPDEIQNMDWNIRIDTLRFTQIITNILSNAIKFTPTGGTISMHLEEISRTGNIVHNKVCISDTGIGMSKEFIENSLFRPFTQEHSSITDTYGGSGLGLSIVKNLVDLMGGKIEVSSELGNGTTFTIYIDVEQVSEAVAEEIQQSSDTAIETNQKAVDGKHILLCEDHPLNAEIAMRLLKKNGCIVEWAENGEIGVSIFNNSKPGHFSAVLMDIRMPVMDGLEAAKAIRASVHPDAKKIPIIAMSANAYEEDIQKSLQAGMNDHLAKPVNPQALLNTLAKYFG